jgi:isopenicillin-N epimerase
MQLGHAIRDEWGLEPGYNTVNHGSYGATPRVVLAAQDAWRAPMESQPSRFMRLELPGALREAAGRMAAFLGAEAQDLAFVSNATEGCNAVIRSRRFAPGDEILVLGHVYGAVRNTIRYVCSMTGAVMVEAPLPFPRPEPGAVVAAVAGAISPRTRLAVLDHITSSSAMVLPIAGMVAACRARGVQVLVDGAHGPGHVPIDLAAIDADWYTGNCHKWLNAAKGCAVLWARRDAQHDLHPAVISHGYAQGFTAEFDWTGTFDPSAWLSVTAALDFHARLGGPALMARNIALANQAATALAARFGTETGHGNGPGGAMAMVRLPSGPTERPALLALRDRLLAAGTDVPLQLHDGQPWLRLSVQAYNEMSDYETMGTLVLDALRA